MVDLLPLSVRIPIFILALFWGLVSAVGILISMVRKGPKKFFERKTRDVRPACLDDPTLGTHQFARLKRIRMHYVISGPEDKPLMLFVHGFPEFWYSWRHQIRALNKDYRCVAIDMRGYGETDKPKGQENYFVENVIEDFREIIIALGYEKCVLVGHDWGGSLVQVFTHYYPKMVHRLILCNTRHPEVLKSGMKNPKQFLMSWYVLFLQIPWLPELQISSYDYEILEELYKKAASPSDVEAFKWSLQLPGGLISPINYYRAKLRYQERKLPSNEIPCPTLMVFGVEDIFIAKEAPASSALYYSDYTLKYVEGVGHWVQMEAPDETTKYMKEFLLWKKDV